MSMLDAKASLLKKAIMLMTKSKVPRTSRPCFWHSLTRIGLLQHTALVADWLTSLLFIITLWVFTVIK